MGGGKQSVPKPLAEVGEMPILWHVMSIYAAQGHSSFVLCLGERGERIEQAVRGFPECSDPGGWLVDFAYTGDDTPTGGRVARIAHLVDDGTFFLTYADGLADIDLEELLAFHREHGRAATVTVVRPTLPWGVVDLDGRGRVTGFDEKPESDGLVNGGFFCFEPSALDVIGGKDVLEREPLSRLASTGELFGFHHRGFWECMDTYKDAVQLNELWQEWRAPWRELVEA